MEKPNRKKKETKDFAFGVSFTELLMSLAAGVGGAFLTAANKVTELFDKDQKNATAFEEHREGYKGVDWNRDREARVGDGKWVPPNGKPPVSKLERLNSITLEQFKKDGKGAFEYWSAVAKEKASIYKDYLGYVERTHGIGNVPILGTIQRFRMLSPSDRKSLFLPGTIGATIGAAMTLGFFNGMVTREKINRIDDAVQADLTDQPVDQKPLAFKDRKPLPPKELPKNDEKTAAHAEKIAKEENAKEERPNGNPAKHVNRFADKYPEVKEELTKDKDAKPASHVERLAEADTEQSFVAAR